MFKYASRGKRLGVGVVSDHEHERANVGYAPTQLCRIGPNSLRECHAISRRACLEDSSPVPRVLM